MKDLFTLKAHLRKLIIRTTLSLLIGAAMLYLASRQLSFEGTLAELRKASWSLLLPYYVLMALQHLCRVWRWGQLLAPIHQVPLARLLPIASVGFTAVSTLPLRIGEFVRPSLIVDRPHLRLSQALGTIIVERVVDGLILILLAFVGIATATRVTRVPEWLLIGGGIGLLFFLAGLAFLLTALWQQARATRLIHAVLKRFSVKLAHFASASVEGIVDGFGALPNRKYLYRFLLATAVYWTTNAACFWLLARGFSLDLSFVGAIALLALIGVGIMIPAGPGFIGNFELFAQVALRLYLDPQQLKARGSAFIVASHAANFSWYLFSGLVSLTSPHVDIGKLWRTFR